MSGGRGGYAIESTLDVARPPNEVFDYLADTRSFKEVDAALVEFEPHGKLESGMTRRFLHRRNGVAVRSTWHVIELAAPGRISVEVRGMGYGLIEEADLEATPTGTRLRFVNRVWPTSLLGRVMVALSGGIVRRDLRERADRLKAVLEELPG